MIHYITIWGENKLGRKLSYSPGGLKKAKYVVDVLSRIDDVKIVSFASGGREWNGCYSKANQKWENNIDIEFCYTFGSKYKYFRMIERWLNILQMIFYFIRVPKDDVIVVYHERYFRYAIKFLKKIRSTPKIILQVEELYTMVGNHPRKMIDTEINSIREADAYILVNDIISSILRLKTPLSCVAYGPYKINDISINEMSFMDNKIHVIYAGTFDRIKRGAEMAVNACRYLPENYCVHIAGFGKPDEVSYIQLLIEKIKSVSQCEIIFEGCLSGKDYDNLLSKCVIGLSTQVSAEFKYSDTSFPSKVINYLSYGLTVVSTKIKVLEISKISDLVSFYTEDNPKAVAEAILSCPLREKNYSIQRIKELDKTFVKQIKEIIQCLKKR